MHIVRFIQTITKSESLASQISGALAPPQDVKMDEQLMMFVNLISIVLALSYQIQIHQVQCHDSISPNWHSCHGPPVKSVGWLTLSSRYMGRKICEWLMP